MTRATFSALLATALLLTGCAYQRDILRYELGITRVTAPTQARHEPIAEPPNITLRRMLTRNGFRAFLHSNAGDLQTAWHAPHPAP